MNNEYNISVIIPCYNSSRTIIRSIESIKNQTYNVDEIICIDDCSSDDTVVILEKMALSDKRIKIVKNKENRGPSYSRNIGFLNSSSQFIAFLDSDDYWHSNKIECQIKLMRYFDADLVSCSYSDGVKINTNNFFFNVLDLNKLLIKNKISTPSVLIRKNVFYYFDESMKYSEDYDLWLKIASREKTILYINKNLVFLDKASFGVSGLSSHLFKMEIGELKSIYKNTNVKQRVLFIPFSILKYIRRTIIVCLRRK